MIMNKTGLVRKRITFPLNFEHFCLESDELFQSKVFGVVHNVLGHLSMMWVIRCFIRKGEVRETVVVLGDIAEEKSNIQINPSRTP